MSTEFGQWAHLEENRQILCTKTTARNGPGSCHRARQAHITEGAECRLQLQLPCSYSQLQPTATALTPPTHSFTLTWRVWGVYGAQPCACTCSMRHASRPSAQAPRVLGSSAPRLGLLCSSVRGPLLGLLARVKLTA